MVKELMDSKLPRSIIFKGECIEKNNIFFTIDNVPVYAWRTKGMAGVICN
jgi:hypothetical protein